VGIFVVDGAVVQSGAGLTLTGLAGSGVGIFQDGVLIRSNDSTLTTEVLTTGADTLRITGTGGAARGTALRVPQAPPHAGRERVGS